MSKRMISSLCLILCIWIGDSGSSPLYTPYHSTEFDIDHEMAIAGVGSSYDTHVPSLDETLSDIDYDSGYDANYDASKYSGGGQKGDSGYKGYNKFEKAILGQHGADGHKSKYNDKGGRKAGHLDQSNYYKDKNAVVKSSQGADFAVSNSYDKGSKTTGFHNVHHKEEYKKNQKFYDEKNKSGHYRRYGDFGAALLSAAGGAANGHRYDAGYKNADYGKQGFTNYGSLYDKLKEYGAGSGQAGYYDNHLNYKKYGGAENGQDYGYYH